MRGAAELLRCQSRRTGDKEQDTPRSSTSTGRGGATELSTGLKTKGEECDATPRVGLKTTGEESYATSLIGLKAKGEERGNDPST